MRKNGFLDRIGLLAFLLAIIVGMNHSAVGQEGQTGSVVYDQGGYTYDITVLYGKPDIKPRYNIIYHWYRNGSLKTTIGDYSGNLLHGSYEKFDGLGRLRTKGKFSLGAKQGVWKSWDFQGKVKAIEKWKNGYLKSRTTFMNDTIKIEPFQDNLLHGKVTKIVNEKVVDSMKYKDGSVKQKREIQLFSRLRKATKKETNDDAKPEK